MTTMLQISCCSPQAGNPVDALHTDQSDQASVRIFPDIVYSFFGRLGAQ